MRITKAEQTKRITRAQELLKARGFNVDDTGPRIVDDLVREFGIQRRTARLLEAKAARLLRGEVVEVWKPGAGRPRNTELSEWQRQQLERLQSIENASRAA